MAERMDKAKSWIKCHYKWLVPVLVALALIIGLVVPLVRNNLAFDKLPLEKTVYITLVHYVEEPYRSSVDRVRRSTDPKVNEEFLERIRQGKKPLYEKGEAGREILFFHLDNGEVLPAYVDDNQLGFQYGGLWVVLEDFSDFTDAMEEVELVEVKDLVPEENTEE